MENYKNKLITIDNFFYRVYDDSFILKKLFFLNKSSKFLKNKRCDKLQSIFLTQTDSQDMLRILQVWSVVISLLRNESKKWIQAHLNSN